MNGWTVVVHLIWIHHDDWLNAKTWVGMSWTLRIKVINNSFYSEPIRQRIEISSSS